MNPGLSPRKSPANPTKARGAARHEPAESRVNEPAAQDDEYIDDVHALQLAIDKLRRRALAVNIINESVECDSIKRFGLTAQKRFYSGINSLLDQGGAITEEALAAFYQETLEWHEKETRKELNHISRELKRLGEKRE